MNLLGSAGQYRYILLYTVMYMRVYCDLYTVLSYILHVCARQKLNALNHLILIAYWLKNFSLFWWRCRRWVGWQPPFKTADRLLSQNHTIYTSSYWILMNQKLRGNVNSYFRDLLPYFRCNIKKTLLCFISTFYISFVFTFLHRFR